MTHHKVGDLTACGLKARGHKTTGQVSCTRCRHSAAYRLHAARLGKHDASTYLERTEAHAFMRELELDYCEGTGQTGRETYSAFYSFPAQADLMVLMANPGGDPSCFNIADVEIGAHEYIEGLEVENPSKSMVRMHSYMLAAIGSDHLEDLRGVQVSNVVWRRSNGVGTFKAIQRMRFEDAIAETTPYLGRLIEYVQPKSLLVAGDTMAKEFVTAHGGRDLEATSTPQESAHGRGSTAVYFATYRLALRYLPEPVDLVTIKHPRFPHSDIEPRIREHYAKHTGQWRAPGDDKR